MAAKEDEASIKEATDDQMEVESGEAWETTTVIDVGEEAFDTAVEVRTDCQDYACALDIAWGASQIPLAASSYSLLCFSIPHH